MCFLFCFTLLFLSLTCNFRLASECLQCWKDVSYWYYPVSAKSSNTRVVMWDLRCESCSVFTSVYTQIRYTTVQPYTTETYTICVHALQYTTVQPCNIHYSCTIRYTAVMYTTYVYKGILQYCNVLCAS